jgi:hypothetical protein
MGNFVLQIGPCSSPFSSVLLSLAPLSSSLAFSSLLLPPAAQSQSLSTLSLSPSPAPGDSTRVWSERRRGSARERRPALGQRAGRQRAAGRATQASSKPRSERRKARGLRPWAGSGRESCARGSGSAGSRGGRRARPIRAGGRPAARLQLCRQTRGRRRAGGPRHAARRRAAPSGTRRARGTGVRRTAAERATTGSRLRRAGARGQWQRLTATVWRRSGAGTEANAGRAGATGDDVQGSCVRAKWSAAQRRSESEPVRRLGRGKARGSGAGTGADGAGTALEQT